MGRAAAARGARAGEESAWIGGLLGDRCEKVARKIKRRGKGEANHRIVSLRDARPIRKEKLGKPN